MMLQGGHPRIASVIHCLKLNISQSQLRKRTDSTNTSVLFFRLAVLFFEHLCMIYTCRNGKGVDIITIAHFCLAKVSPKNRIKRLIDAIMSEICQLHYFHVMSERPLSLLPGVGQRVVPIQSRVSCSKSLFCPPRYSFCYSTIISSHILK